ncbi:MAG: aminotransferase class I/II-fold pyridoxal phosphate-dependent enzyme, partial [Candidatus Hinthialibacter sp.]
DHNLWVIADEVYSQIIFDGEFHSITSIPGMKERTIIVDGFSKTYAMTGWRLGYGVMNKLLAEQVAKIETNIDSCACTFSQIAGTQAMLGPQDESRYMIEQFKERSKLIVDGLNAIEGVRCLPAQGAFYVFPNVTGACRRLGMQTANELQRGLLEQAGVAVLPRTCFGRKNEGEDQEYIRLSFATSTENIREGLKRMKQYIER